ncbi:RNA pseudouridine synthase, partial [Vibrio splendidus]
PCEFYPQASPQIEQHFEIAPELPDYSKLKA